MSICSTFTAERCHGSWQPCLIPLSSEPGSLLPLHIMNRTLLTVGSTPSRYSDSRPPSPCTDIEDGDSDGANAKEVPPPSDREFPLVIINTNFDRSHEDNKKFPIKRHSSGNKAKKTSDSKKSSREAGFIWTEKDRKKAMSAIIPKDMVTFETHVRKIFSSLILIHLPFFSGKTGSIVRRQKGQITLYKICH